MRVATISIGDNTTTAFNTEGCVEGALSTLQARVEGGVCSTSFIRTYRSRLYNWVLYLG